MTKKDANRPFAGPGHVTMSIMKIGGSSKWLPEMKRGEISKVAYFEAATA